MKKERNIGNILRWTAMPFAASIGAFFLYWVCLTLLDINNINPWQLTDATILKIFVAQAIFGISFVWCGAKTAPSHHHKTAKILAYIMAGLSIFVLLWDLFGGKMVMYEMIEIIATAVGAFFVCPFVKDANTQSKQEVQDVKK